jgi:hypothetical protein
MGPRSHRLLDGGTAKVSTQETGRESLNLPVNMKKRETTMNQLKKIGLLLLVSGLFAGVARAETPDATIKFSGGSVALGIGWSWGGGTLMYKGKEYPISVKGLSIGKVGVTGVTASGEVHHLKSLKDFDGNYTGVGAGITLAGGRTAVTIKNQNGVRVRVISTTRGADLTVGLGGVDMRLKK